MKKIVVYGLGNNFIFSYNELIQYYDIVALSDGNADRIGTSFWGYEVLSIGEIEKFDYDFVVVTPVNNNGIKNSLVLNGIEEFRIITLQKAFDNISDTKWIEGKIRYSIDVKKRRYAIIFYGGMGDLIVGKLWLEKILVKYNIDVKQLELYFSNGNLNDGKYIFKDLIEVSNMYPIDALSKNAENGEFDVIFRFCIIPEILKINKQTLNSGNNEFEIYMRRLFDLQLKEYNRGFHTAGDYYKTISKFLVNRKGVVYHTAYDVFGDLNVNDSDKVKLLFNDADEMKVLNEFGLKGKKYVTLNTGLNIEYINKMNTREWPFDKWKLLAQRIKDRYPEMIIVQVGLKLREEDDIGTDICLNGRTQLGQIAIVLKNAYLHIDYDGGLVHVNHMVGGKSVVLMGPSAASNHAYPENIYISSGVCEPCEWDESDWLSRCLKGFECVKCMDSISVDMVMDAIDL